MRKILIIEDDKGINNGICFNLELENFKVFQSFNLKVGEEILNKENIDLIILDVNLPDGNGFDFCKKIREKSNVPIIFLTANNLEVDQVIGFKIGGDDYITKPFSIMLLIERIKAILRRRVEDKKDEILRSGKFSLDLRNLSFYKEDIEIPLSQIEFKIMKKFMESEKKNLKRDELLKELWNDDLGFVEEHTLTVNINRLRGKIEKDKKNPKHIKTVYKVGYVWIGEEDE